MRDRQESGECDLAGRLMQNATVAMFAIDDKHRVISWNHACEVLTGIQATEILGTGNHCVALYQDQRPCLADLLLDRRMVASMHYYDMCRQSTMNPEGLQAEGWMTLKGERRYMLLSAAPVRNDQGSLVAVIETLEDITYRKEQEDELASIAKAVSIAGGEGFFTAVAQYIAKTLGVDYVLIGRYDLQHPSTVTSLAFTEHGEPGAGIKYQLAGSPFADVMNWSICSRPSGAGDDYPQDMLISSLKISGYIGIPLMGIGRVPLGILLVLHASAIRNPEHALMMLRIFAARTAAEMQRKTDEERLRKLSYAVAQSPVTIMITDTQGRIEFVNPKFTQVTGYSADEVLGMTPAILKSGETSAEVYTAMWETISKGETWEGVFHNRRKDGDLYWERAFIGPIKNEAGEITNYIGIKEDITDQKRIEGFLRHSQKMEAVGQLASGVAHDFNNILTAIIGYASILEIQAGDVLDIGSGLQQIAKAAERGANLTKGLLTYSRWQAENLQKIDLNEVVSRSEKLLGRLLGENVDLRVSLDSESLMVNVDGLEIEQVLMNLITNARDAMPKGGVISVVTGKAMINRKFVRDYGFGVPGQYAVLCVSDTGEGMDKKTSDKIFEPFFTTKEAGHGTGLGLAIVYNIVKSHKGNIICTSAPGEGTSFTIYLPRYANDRELQKDVLAAVPVAMGTEMVLVAEDEEEVRNLLCSFLEENGYRVVAAADGEEALALFHELQDDLDIVLLDAGMPKMSGVDALVAMRRMRPQLKAIIFSGYAKQDSLHALGEEAVSFIAKPIGREDLVRAVREELDR